MKGIGRLWSFFVGAGLGVSLLFASEVLAQFDYILSANWPVALNEHSDGDDIDVDDIELDSEEAEFEIFKPAPPLSSPSPEAQLDDPDDFPGWTAFSRAFRESARFRYRHELSYRLSPGEVVVNRSSLRLQWERLFASHYYIRFDGKASYNFASDKTQVPEQVHGHDRFRSPVREFFLQASFGEISIKAGKQIVVWGKADSGVVTDVISPRDMTEGLFAPIEDVRVGQTMVTVDFYPGSDRWGSDRWGSDRWTLVVNPDPQINELPSSGYQYAFASSLEGDGASLDGDGASLEGDGASVERDGAVRVVDEKPDFDLKRPEVGLRWGRNMAGMDIAIMAAELVSNDAVFVSQGLSAAVPFSLLLSQEYQRFLMVGAGINVSDGNFLWKAELAYKRQRAFNRNDFFTSVEGGGIVESDVWDGGFGFDYTAGGTYTITVEAANQHVVAWDDTFIGVRRSETIVYFSWSKPFMHDTLTPQYTWVYQTQDRESLHQLSATYDINDQWACKVEIDYFDARKEDSLFGFFQDHHRLYGELLFHF